MNVFQLIKSVLDEEYAEIGGTDAEKDKEVKGSHHARARDSCSRRLGAKLSGNIKARSLEPLPSRTMIVP